MVMNGHTLDAQRRQALGNFLRGQRELIKPEEVGLNPRGRRRVHGLRRSEAADLAAISITWYTWLEQGRDIRVSTDVMDSIASVFGLDEEAHEHLRRLAGAPPREPLSSTPVTPSDLKHIDRLLEDVVPSPAWLTVGPGYLAQWNGPFVRLFGDPADLPDDKRNMLALLLLSPVARRNIVHWQAAVEYCIEAFVAEAARYPSDTRLTNMIAELSELDEEFKVLWNRHKVRIRKTVPPVFTVRHPDIDEVRLELIRLRPPGQPTVLLLIARHVDEESRSRLALLMAA